MIFVTNSSLLKKEQMKRRLIFSLSFILIANVIFAQVISPSKLEEPGFAIYLNGPTGFISKIRVKAEMRMANKTSIIGSYSDYHLWVGNQSYLEFRKYKSKALGVQSYHYGKLGRGQSNDGRYILAGFGWGTQRLIGKEKRFFIDYSRGFKLCPRINSGDLERDMDGGFRGLFYLLGPGAIYDVNLNIGYRF